MKYVTIVINGQKHRLTYHQYVSVMSIIDVDSSDFSMSNFIRLVTGG
jgi:hypothetical protein